MENSKNSQSKIRAAWLGFSCALFWLAQGCSTTTTITVIRGTEQFQTFHPKAAIVVKEAVADTAPGGLPMFDVTFKNIKNSEQFAWYWCEWFDNRDMKITSSLYHWETLRLMGQGERVERFSAFSDTAQTLRVTITDKNPK